MKKCGISDGKDGTLIEELYRESDSSSDKVMDGFYLAVTKTRMKIELRNTCFFKLKRILDPHRHIKQIKICREYFGNRLLSFQNVVDHS